MDRPRRHHRAGGPDWLWLGGVRGLGGPYQDPEAYNGSTFLGRSSLSNGTATVTVGPFDTVGAKTIEIRYLGDRYVSSSRTTTTVTAMKWTPKKS